MNPRYRRLLIPGLLVLLLVVVIISSLAHRAEGAEAEPEVVSRMTDPRIAESSGLALSTTYDGIAYTINDSGNEPLVFAIDVATGRTVGTTRVTGGSLLDTEALAIDADGTLWIADTGDNAESRKDAALYALPEQGSGDHVVQAKRYPITYDSDLINVEALLVSPTTGDKFLVSKALFAGRIYALPEKLSTGRPNIAAALPVDSPSGVTDATFTTDGKLVVMRSYTSLFLIDPTDWSQLGSTSTPPQQQGESITAEKNSLLIGSEGSGSELIRVPIPSATGPKGMDTVPDPDATETPPPKPAATPKADDPDMAPLVFVVGAVVAAGILGAGVTYAMRRTR